MNIDKIRVGLDVDGVMRDFVGQIAKLAYEETGVLVEAPTKYYHDIQKQTGISFRKRIWGTKEWAESVFEGAPILEGAREGYNNFINDEKYEVYIVTSQTDDTKHHTINWLKNNEFDKHKGIYVTSKKLEAPCQILIDDKPSNIEDYNGAARLGILVDASYNKEYQAPRRVSNLNEAYKLLKEMYG